MHGSEANFGYQERLLECGITKPILWRFRRERRTKEQIDSLRADNPKRLLPFATPWG